MDNDTVKMTSNETEEVIEEIIEESLKKTHWIKRLLISMKSLIIAILIVALCYGIYYSVSAIFGNRRAKMPESHVYVCDNPENLSDFDNWLKENITTVGEDKQVSFWVPTYVIIKNGDIIGAFRGDIPESQFSTYVAMISANDLHMITLPNYEISNLEGKRDKLSNIFSGSDLYILELHWVDCPDCQHQDESYTEEIYRKYGTKKIYRYYIKSNKDKVAEKYSD